MTHIYGKVSLEIWGDDKFCALSPQKPSAQTLWIYLLVGTFRTSIPGMNLRVGIGALSDRLGWSPAIVQKHWSEIEGQQMAEADWRAGVIWLPRAIEHNVPESPNVIRGWEKVVLPECELVGRAIRSLRLSIYEDVFKNPAKPKKGFLEAFDEVFRKDFAKDLTKGSAVPFVNQEQEQEQEQEQDLNLPKTAAVPNLRTSAAPLIMSPRDYEKTHKSYAFYGSRLKVPHVLHRELRDKLGGENPEAALQAWYLAINAEAEESREPIADVFVWLRPKFVAWAEAAAFDAAFAKMQPRGAR